MKPFHFRKHSIVSLFVAAGYAVTILLKGTTFVLIHVVPVLQIVDVCAAFICVPLFGLAVFRKTRPVAAHGFLFMAYLFGVSNWMYAFVVLCASPPMEPVSYFYGVLTIFFALSVPGRFSSHNKPGSFLAFMTAFPVCAVVSALLQGAPFASLIVGIGLTYAIMALSILLRAGAREEPAHSANNSGARPESAGSIPAARSPVSYAWQGSTNPASNSGAPTAPTGPRGTWKKYLDTEARIMSGQSGSFSRETPLDPSPKKMSSSNPSDKRAKKVVRCPGCSTKLSLPAGKTGQVKCPRCGRMFKAST
jgi:uncharacterized Zn-finger protein